MAFRNKIPICSLDIALFGFAFVFALISLISLIPNDLLYILVLCRTFLRHSQVEGFHLSLLSPQAQFQYHSSALVTVHL